MGHGSNNRCTCLGRTGMASAAWLSFLSLLLHLGPSLLDSATCIQGGSSPQLFPHMSFLSGNAFTDESLEVCFTFQIFVLVTFFNLFDKIPDLNNLKEEMFGFGPQVLGHLCLGKTQWWWRNLFTSWQTEAEREMKEPGQDTPKNLPTMTYFLQLGSTRTSQNSAPQPGTNPPMHMSFGGTINI